MRFARLAVSFFPDHPLPPPAACDRRPAIQTPVTEIRSANQNQILARALLRTRCASQPPSLCAASSGSDLALKPPDPVFFRKSQSLLFDYAAGLSRILDRSCAPRIPAG